MHRLTAALALATSFANLAMASPASANGPGGVDVTENIPGRVDTTVEIPGEPGSNGDGGGARPAGGGPTITCTIEEGGAFGSTYLVRVCSDATQTIYVPPTPGTPGTPSLTPVELAQSASNRLTLPRPAVGFSPDPASHPYQLVNLPVWWWTLNWAPLSQRTAVGGVFAEVTATPVQSAFDGGDGSEPMPCDRAGQVWHSGLAEDSPKACRFTYRHSGTGLTATITTTWRVTWVGSGGSGGRLPDITTSTSQQLTVYERQAVNTYGRG